MASTIKLKNSTTAGNAPSSLETGEVAINVADGNLFYGSASAVLQNFVIDELEVKGNLTAQQYIISSSVTHTTQSFSSGSTVFGDTQDDTHLFTGSISVTGSVTATSFTGDGSGLTGIVTTTGTPADNQVAVFTDSNTVEGSSKLLFDTNHLDIVSTNNSSQFVRINGGVYGAVVPYITPMGSTTLNFGDSANGHIFDFLNNKIAFDNDSTNTYIMADTDSPENLEIAADGNIELRADNDIWYYGTGHRMLRIDASTYGSASIRLQGNSSAGANKIDAINNSLELQVESTTIAEIESTGIDVTGDVTASGDISASGDIIGDTLTVNAITFPQDTNITIQTPDEDSPGGDGGNLTLEAGNGAGSNGDGGDLIFNAGKSNGSGVSGDIIFNTFGTQAGGGTSGSLIINSKDVDISGTVDVSGTVFATDIATQDITSGNASGISMTIKPGHGFGSSATGGDLILKSGRGTGTGPGGDITIQPQGGNNSSASTGSINLTSPSINITGTITSSGDITASGDITCNNITIAGDITSVGDDVVVGDNLIITGSAGAIKFKGTDGGGNEGILYKDSGGSNRFGLIFPGSDVVALANRASSGKVEIRANNATAGDSGEVTVAEFLDDLATLNVTTRFSIGGSSSSPVISRTTDTNTGIYFPSGDSLGLAAGGSEKFRASTIGNFSYQSLSVTSGDLSVANDIVHYLDTDTQIRFSTNNISLEAGGTQGAELDVTGSTLPNVKHNVYDTSSAELGAAGGAIGDIVKFGGSTTTAGKIYYLRSNGTWSQARANSSATATSSLAVALGTNSTTDGMCLRGIIYPSTDPGATIGNPVFLSDTADGEMLATAPDTSGDFVRIVGHQFGTNLIYFNPSPDFIELS